MRKTIIGIIIFAALLAIAYVSYEKLTDYYKPTRDMDTSSSESKERIKAPDFTVYGSDGNSVNLSDFAGKPVVINFWASWCPPCKSEMPHFDEAYDEFGDRIDFMMIDEVDGQRETQETGQNYIDDQGYNFPVYFDLNQQVGYLYGINSIPVTLLVDSQGYIVKGYQGAIDKETLISALDSLE